MAKQSVEDRRRRLADGCCPIHGIPMVEDNPFMHGGVQHYFVDCPRKDCEISGSKNDETQVVTLQAKYQYLVDGDEPDSVQVETVDLKDFKRHPMQVMHQADGLPVQVCDQGTELFYMITPDLFHELMRRKK
ncbi:hypothetical protein ACYPKM_04105 [Pseudomonas aeruginosa]